MFSLKLRLRIGGDGRDSLSTADARGGHCGVMIHGSGVRDTLRVFK